VKPDYGHTKLQLAKEGLEAIQRIRTPIAAVSVCSNFISPLSQWLIALHEYGVVSFFITNTNLLPFAYQALSILL
jgi:hypothetical protein